jgi:hypothetical protein
MLRWLLWWRPPCLLRAVIVNLRDDPQAIKGVLWSARGPWLVLVDATLLAEGVPPTRIDGEVVLHRSIVKFLQVIP